LLLEEAFVLLNAPFATVFLHLTLRVHLAPLVIVLPTYFQCCTFFSLFDLSLLVLRLLLLHCLYFRFSHIYFLSVAPSNFN
jgi:hypothetical protein